MSGDLIAQAPSILTGHAKPLRRTPSGSKWGPSIACPARGQLAGDAAVPFRVFTTAPRVQVSHGQAQPGTMRRNRISAEELHQAVRAARGGDLAAVSAVVLETDGTRSVIPSSTAGDLSTVPDQELGGSTGDSGGAVGAWVGDVGEENGASVT